MVKTPISATDRQASSSSPPGQDEAGFTLLELLIVLAIVGVVLAIAVPGLRSHAVTSGAVQSARLVVTDLADARRRAIFSNRRVDLFVDVVTQSVRIAADEPRQLIGIDRLSVVTTASLGAGAEGGIIRFFPDGSSAGGEIEITDTKGKTARLRINWLTGRVALDA